MAIIPIKAGGGANTDFVTATAGRILYPYVGVDTEGEPITGNIPTRNESGNTTLTPSTTAKSFSAGYYPASHGAIISPQEKSITPGSTGIDVTPDNGKVLSKVKVAAVPTQEKSVTPGVSAQSVLPDTGKFLSKVSVGAIPSQKTDSGNVTLTSGAATKSYAAGYYGNAHGATVPVYTGG